MSKQKGPFMFRVIVVAIALLIGTISIIVTRNFHNPVEKFFSEVIEHETGINFDAMFPEGGSSCPDAITEAAPHSSEELDLR